MEQKWQKEGQKGYHQTHTSPFLRRSAYFSFYSHMQLSHKLLQCFFQASPRPKLVTQKAKRCQKE
jgi:heme oxygenase